MSIDFDQRYIEFSLARDYPPALPEEQPQDMPSMDGVQLAAGPSQTMTDAGAGRGSYAGFNPRQDVANKGTQPEMRAYDPTTRERIASFLQAGFEGLGMDRYKARQNAQTLIGGGSSNLPLDMGLADIVPFLGTALQTEEAVNMGGEAVQSAKQGNYGTAALQAGGAVLGLVPGAAGTVKAAKGLKNLPVGMSTEAVGGMDGVLTQTAKATAPVNDMGFYSAVEQAALNIQRKSGTGQAMLNDITKGQDVKLDEVKWIGLDDFLKGKKNVTKEEVQQYIAQNKVDIQEVTLGEDGGAAARNIAAQDIGETLQAGGTLDDDAQHALKVWREGDPTSRYTRQQEALLEEKLREAGDNRTVAEFLDAGSAQTDNTRYGQYTLPGGENYREILLTLPAKRLSEDEARKVLGAKPDAKLSDADISYASRKAVDEYRSSHWSQPNVLAHIRVNDRVDADGKKMLLVEEVQSDWHQAGRDKGYASDVGPKVSDAEYKRGVELQQRDVRGESLSDAERQEMQDILRRHEASIPALKVPDAPMKDTWYQLALKRVLKYAADNGYERVGLTTGKTNAERFDLSKQVDEIAVPTVNSDGTRSVRIDPIEGSSIKLMVDADGVVKGYGPSSNQFTGKKLNEVVGKEMAEKIMAADKETKFTGLDLQVGGEGMKKYYDEVYPQFLAKYGKKWGAKVGETKLKTSDIDPARWTIVRDADNNFRIQDSLSDRFAEPGAYATREDAIEAIGKMNYREPVRFVDITPEMRQGVGKGQPLFTATGIGAGTTGATMQDKEQK